MKIVKKLVTLFLAALMVMGTFTTVFAENEGAFKLYGQELLQRGSSTDTKVEYVAIVVGADAIGVDNFSIADASKTFQSMLGPSYNSHMAKPFKLTELSDLADLRYLVLNNDDSYYEPIQLNKNGVLPTTDKATELNKKIRFIEYSLGKYNEDGEECTTSIYACKLPSGIGVESLGELSKYVVYADGSNQTDQTKDKNASWESDDKGWWIQYPDGTYLTNAWYHDTDGKFYYMGEDGYMLINTTTPDGYCVDAVGVRLENPVNSNPINQ